jgi:hypothetical protein
VNQVLESGKGQAPSSSQPAVPLQKEDSAQRSGQPLQRIVVEERYLNEIPASVPAEPGMWFSSAGIQAIYYDGPRYHGNPTKVFAYYGIPQEAKKGGKVPAIVLVRGGSGTA